MLVQTNMLSKTKPRFLSFVENHFWKKDRIKQKQKKIVFSYNKNAKNLRQERNNIYLQDQDRAKYVH